MNLKKFKKSLVSIVLGSSLFLGNGRHRSLVQRIEVDAIDNLYLILAIWSIGTLCILLFGLHSVSFLHICRLLGFCAIVAFGLSIICYVDRNTFGFLFILSLLSEFVRLNAKILIGTELLYQQILTLLGNNRIRILFNLEVILLQELHYRRKPHIQLFLYFI